MIPRSHIVLIITDGHGYYAGDHDWATKELGGLKTRLERLQLGHKGFAKFNNVTSPAVSTIMSIESILGGIFAAKAHKKHWREWPEWDRLDLPMLSTFLQQKGYEVNGFSYLLNAENWMPAMMCYKPELYLNFPSHKRDTHSHQAVLAVLKDFFATSFKPGPPQLLLVHSIFVFDFWDEMMELFNRNGLNSENTVFAFTADHYFPKNFGRQWLFGERDGALLAHHTDLTEYNTRVFLYLKFPGLLAREFDDLIAGYDITPTLLDLLSLKDQWPGKFDGQSLLPLLKGVKYTDRLIRNDNVYPYQIGEKQGRITAIRFGRFKYVSRPDPGSSYIVYRMHEPWSHVMGHEEFYDVISDPEEQHNLVASTDPALQSALARCRSDLRKTTDEILDHHTNGLVLYGQKINLGAQLLGQKKSGKMLCFQSCPPEVAVTLLNVISEILPAVKVDVVARDLDGHRLASTCTVFHYDSPEIFTQDGLALRLGAAKIDDYDCVVRFSNLPIGDYAGAYDDRAQPRGDYSALEIVLKAYPRLRRLTLALDLSIQLIGDSSRPVTSPLAKFRGVVFDAPAKWALGRMKPRLRRWMLSIEGKSDKIAPYLSERIILEDETD